MGKRLQIYGEIGWGVNLAWTLDMLSQMEVGAEDHLTVNIHSPGGDVLEGWAIHNALLNTGAKITTVADGLVGSIATIIFLAGSNRIMQQGTQFFIHNPWAVVGGDADVMEKMAADLRKAESEIFDYYIKRTGADEDRVRDYMTQETGLSAQEALELGFATEMREPVYALAKLGTRPQITNPTNMDKKTLVASFKEAIQDVFGKKEPKALTLSLATGEQIDIITAENEAVEGDAVILSEGKKTLEDGPHALSDNRTLVIEQGKIARIEEAPEILPAEVAALFTESLKGIKAQMEADMAETKALVTAATEQIKALKSENDELKNELEAVKRETPASQYNAPKSHGTDTNQPDTIEVKSLKQAISEKRKEFSK